MSNLTKAILAATLAGLYGVEGATLQDPMALRLKNIPQGQARARGKAKRKEKLRKKWEADRIKSLPAGHAKALSPLTDSPGPLD